VRRFMCRLWLVDMQTIIMRNMWPFNSQIIYAFLVLTMCGLMCGLMCWLCLGSDVNIG
jgi:hypothetical protein